MRGNERLLRLQAYRSYRRTEGKAFPAPQASSLEEMAEKAMHLMFIVRFLERLGDHLLSVCECGVYAKRREHAALRSNK